MEVHSVEGKSAGDCGIRGFRVGVCGAEGENIGGCGVGAWRGICLLCRELPWERIDGIIVCGPRSESVPWNKW